MDKISRFIDDFFQSPSVVVSQDGELVNGHQLKDRFHVLLQWLGIIKHEIKSLAIVLPKDMDYLLTVLACMRLGIPFIPLNVDWPFERINQIKELSKFDFLITEKIIQEIFICAPTLSISIRESDFSETQVLYTLFTSGTTGAPKGVQIPRIAYANFLSWMNEEFLDITSKDNQLNITEFTFDVFLADIGIFLTRKTKLYFSNFKNNIFKLMQEIQDNKISVFVSVPNNLNMMLTEKILEKADITSLRFGLIAGSIFNKNLYQKIKKFLPNFRIYNCYGPTEFTIYCTFAELNADPNIDADGEVMTIGKPLPNLKSFIIDQAGKILPPGEKGELVVAGPQRMLGYINDSSLTQKVTVVVDGNDCYKTGDIAFQNSAGQFFVVGRVDDTIKVSGYRINLSDVNAYIKKLIYVVDAFTLATADEAKGNEMHTFLIVNKKSLTSKEIRLDLAQILPSFQIPHKYYLLENFPTNSSGKIDKNELRLGLLQGKYKLC